MLVACRLFGDSAGVHKNRKNWMAAIFFLSVSTRNRFILLSNVSTLSRRNYYLHKFRRKTIITVGWKNYSISFFLKFQCKKRRERGATSNICGRLGEQTEFEGKLTEKYKIWRLAISFQSCRTSLMWWNYVSRGSQVKCYRAIAGKENFKTFGSNLVVIGEKNISCGWYVVVDSCPWNVDRKGTQSYISDF